MEYIKDELSSILKNLRSSQTGFYIGPKYIHLILCILIAGCKLVSPCLGNIPLY
jgi:hypothetical protein